MRLRARHIGTAVAVVAVVGALVYAFRPQPVLVDLAEVTRGALAETVREEGYTEVREVYVVSAPIAGRLLRVQAEVGDTVEIGEALLRIRPTDPAFLDVRSQSEAQAGVRSAEANLALARAEIGRAKAEVDFAVSELRRARELADRGTISAQTLERRQLELKTARAARSTAEAAVRARTAELEQARARLIEPTAAGGPDELSAVQVRAPVAGRVLRLMQESETVVAAGMPLIELGDPSRLEIVAELLSTDAVRLREGAEVRIFDWGGPESLAGRIRRIEPFGFKKISALGIEEQRVKVLIDFVEPPPPGLGHGYRVEIKAVAWAGEDVAQVPLGALFRDGDTWAVFAVDGEGIAHMRPLRLGHLSERAAELVEGLSPGDRVILHPDERISEGTWVESRGNGDT